jgi:DNA-binding PadR family transcriptional regulator
MSERVEGSGARVMRSQVNWALLGLVIERPSYGYELAARFLRAYGEILYVSSDSHIYKALNALEDRSLISASPWSGAVSGGTDRQPKRHYRATDLGREGYQAQLVEQMREARRRSQLLVRQLAVFADKPWVALQVIDGMERMCLEEAVKARVPSVPLLQDAAAPASALVAGLAAEESRLTMEATLPWIEYARRVFKARASSEVPPR